MIKVSTTGMAVSLKTDLRFPESGQHGHGSRIIHCVFNEYQGNKFDDLWVYVEMMLEYKILTYHDEVEEYEIEGQYGMGKECNIYRQYYINV